MDKNYFKCKTDEIIIYEGQKLPCMYFVVKGAVALYINYKEKNEYILGVCGKNKIFGEMGLIVGGESLYTAVALTDVSIVRVTDDNLFGFIREHPDKLEDILRSLGNINFILKHNVEMLVSETMEKTAAEKRNDQLKKNLAKYSVRGIDVYKNDPKH